METTFDKLSERTQKEWNDIVEEFATKPIREVIRRNAYKLAHYNELAEQFMCEDTEQALGEELCLKMLNYNGNVLKRIYDFWLGLDTEYHNFFYPQDLLDIIKGAFEAE